MRKLKEMNKITLYIISIIIVYILLILINLFFNKEEAKYAFRNYEYKKNNISEKTDKHEIEVNYPRFYKENTSKIITDYLYKYISDFKKQSEKTEKIEKLKINYELEIVDNYYNVLFNISNSLNSNDKYKNFLIDNKTEKEKFISDIYGEDILNEIKELINIKYPEVVYKSIENFTIKDFSYSFKENYINVYINKNLINNIVSYDIFVTKILNEEKYVFEEYGSENVKYMAFTFDDGPSEYTKEVVDTFSANNSKATFFMLGNRMKVLPELVKYTSDKGMEIGSHSYSHKNLTAINNDEMLEEINSVTILYKEITGGDLTLLRPPYGSINDTLKNNSPYPLVTWNIDPYDWLHRDSEYIKNHILNTAFDGGIIIMHDLYPTSVVAIKELVPLLVSQGYKLVTVSELSKIKGIELTPGMIYK